MKATFDSLEWNKADSNIYTGYRDGAKPKGAIKGGNGTYRVVDGFSELILNLDTPQGPFSQDILYQVKKEMDWKKLSDKRFDKLEKAFASSDWEVSEDGRILNLRENLSMV